MLKTNETHKKELFSTQMLAVLGILLAMDVVLTRFMSYSVWNMRIGFGFVPVVISAMLFGPLPTAVLAALGDFLGAVLFPIGPYFPGFTLTAALTGLTFGFFLHRGKSIVNTLAAVLIVQFVLGLLLNTFWIHLLYHSPYVPLLATRVLQAALLTVVQTATIQALLPLTGRLKGSVAA
ncbi:MAG: folate family ECF transporter S component [Oscillospiraceae bacterium]|nr:folate family ECF transporter S component [Oscillospiraceae bacterium]